MKLFAFNSLFKTRLEALAEKCEIVQEVRVVGLMVGIELSVEGTPVVSKCMDRRLLVNCTQGTVIRLLPAMNLTTAEVEEGCDILSEVIQSLGI